jgi:hypothetical protein
LTVSVRGCQAGCGSWRSGHTPHLSQAPALSPMAVLHRDRGWPWALGKTLGPKLAGGREEMPASVRQCLSFQTLRTPGPTVLSPPQCCENSLGFGCGLGMGTRSHTSGTCSPPAFPSATRRGTLGMGQGARAEAQIFCVTAGLCSHDSFVTDFKPPDAQQLCEPQHVPSPSCPHTPAA